MKNVKGRADEWVKGGSLNGGSHRWGRMVGVRRLQRRLPPSHLLMSVINLPDTHTHTHTHTPVIIPSFSSTPTGMASSPGNCERVENRTRKGDGMEERA